jgi:hypothetical protein
VFNNPLKYVDPSGHCPSPLSRLCDYLGWRSEFPFVKGGLRSALLAYALNVAANSAQDVLFDASLATATNQEYDVLSEIGPTVFLNTVTGGLSGDAKRATQLGSRRIKEVEKIANIKGAGTLIDKLRHGSDLVRYGAEFELDYALRYKDEIIEIGRNFGGGKEIDFIMKGNVFVNVKAYDWSKYNDFLLNMEAENLVKQATDFSKHQPTAIKYVFWGSVPDGIRQALEEAGVIVEVIQ